MNFTRIADVHEILNKRKIKDEIETHGTKYKNRQLKHPNELAEQLTIPETICSRMSLTLSDKLDKKKLALMGAAPYTPKSPHLLEVGTDKL